MKRHRHLLIGFALSALLWRCAPMAAPPERLDRPVMPPMAPRTAADASDQPVPVFGSAEVYTLSPLQGVHDESLFEVHGKGSNRIALLRNGDDSFAVRVQLLEQAKRSIRIQALVFWGDESGLYIAEILKRKKAEGLDVRVIVDAASNLGLQTQWMYFDLKQHGIEVQGYESLYLEWINEVPIPFLSPADDPEAPNHRYHEKLWIVDGETGGGTAVVGGLNIANAYFRVDPTDPDENWRDQDIVVKGSILADMVTAFERNYDHFVDIKESRAGLNTDLYWEATRNFLDKVGKLAIAYTTDPRLDERVAAMAHKTVRLDFEPARSRFFHNRPRLEESYIRQAYAKLFDWAEREILICNAYFIPSPEFIASVRAAAARGVRVVILTNSPQTNDLPEMTMVGRSYYQALLAINAEAPIQSAGGRVEIWEWQGRRYDSERQTDGTIHAKYAVFDRRISLVGSYNLDPRSEKLNSETAVVFQNDRLAAQLAGRFYDNDLAYSRRVTPADADAFSDPSDALYKLRKEFGGLFEPLL